MRKKNEHQNGKSLLSFKKSTSFVKKLSLGLVAALSISACKNALVGDLNVAPEKVAAVGTSPLQLVAANSNSFKVMSFNTRHNDAGDPQSITERRPLIKQIIIDNDPDIVGLQEYSDQSFETWFNAEMETLGYGKYYDQTSTSTPKVIFFKTNRFTLQDSGTKYIGNDSRYATWAILLDQVTSKRYFISNSHWQHDSQAKREINAQEVVDMVNLHNPEGLPEIVFGDFNAEPGTSEINIVKNGLNVLDALGEEENTFHGWDATGSKKLDWIMTSKDMAILSWDVIRTSYSGNWPSDHFPVIATFVPGIYNSAVTDALGSGSSNSRFYFADIDGDGKKDKILWRYNLDSGKPRVYLSNGNGTFNSSFISHTASASAALTSNYYFADVNGDGKADLILWNAAYTSGKTRVYLATTGGSFSATAIEQDASTSAATRFYFADVNGDGKADKIYWNPTYDTGNNRVYFATTGGSFSTSYALNTNASTESTNSTYYYADINGDGKADKILWHPSNNDGKTMVYLSNGDGQFTLSSAYSTAGPSSTATTRYYFADINGDGRADKIFWRPDAYLGKAKIYFSGSDGNFDAPLFSLRAISKLEDTNFYFADINGDGKADQIFWNNGEYEGDFKNYLAL